MSKWGHPVFSVGSTPYYAHDAGQGNYPGGNGFIPGYGYYPGQGPDHYPWLDGPDSPPYPSGGGLFGLRRKPPEIPPAAYVEAAVPAGVAIITIQVPPDAQVWFDKTRTAQLGTLRRYATPALAAGVSPYRLRVVWTADAKPIEQTRQIDVRPGDRLTVSFLGETIPVPLPVPPGTGSAVPGVLKVP